LGLRIPAVSASSNGVLAYTTGVMSGPGQLAWFGRRLASNVGEPGAQSHPALSPDEKRVAVTLFESGANADLWIDDMTRSTRTRLTFDPATDSNPVWSPDGARIAFSSNRSGRRNLHVKAASGAGADELLFQSESFKVPHDWSGDGRHLVFSEFSPKTSYDLWMLGIEKRKASLYLQTEFNEQEAQFSPDGRWMAYVSDESKTFQVYVRSFPISGGKWQVSVSGGSQPRWRRDGKELYFISPDKKVMAVAVKLGASFEAGVPKVLFTSRIVEGNSIGMNYDVSGDGQRFLINTVNAEVKQDPITVVANWK
jgi:Tol biopolymer transport system component